MTTAEPEAEAGRRLGFLDIAVYTTARLLG
jgi:hypothetical protein